MSLVYNGYCNCALCGKPIKMKRKIVERHHGYMEVYDEIEWEPDEPAGLVYDWVCAECYSHLDRSVLSYLKARFKKRIDNSNEVKDRYYQEYLKKCKEVDDKKQKDDEILSYLMSVNSITKIKPDMVGYGYENAVLDEALKKLKNNS